MEEIKCEIHRSCQPGLARIEFWHRLVAPRKFFYKLITFTIVVGIWQLASMHYKSNLLLPSPLKTGEALFSAVQDLYTLQNLLLTMKRLVIGLGIALGLGLTVGFTMGSSGAFLKLMDPIISTIRQVPIMAWVPLTIIWFGLGDGPTLFLIAMVGVFPIVLNTIAGVQSIPKNYFHAARSLGATPWGIFSRVTLPASLPGIMTGLRIALGAGWMSVICAEFIATSAGFGFSMVQAQTMMETPLLIALMIISAGVGYSTDIFIRNMEKKITKWRFVS